MSNEYEPKAGLTRDTRLHCAAPSPGAAGLEPVTVVDTDNRVVGESPRHLVRERNLPHRATYIFVFDRRDRVLVQRRTTTKDLYPGYFDAAAGGVVAAGESYDACARRELGEELGIEAELEPAFEFYYEDELTRCFGKVYRCAHEGPFRLQPEEVESVRFVPVEEVLAGGCEPMTPDTLVALHRLLEGG